MSNLAEVEEFCSRYHSAFTASVEGAKATDRQGSSLPIGVNISQLCEISSDLQKRNARQFIIGSGASAAFADHMASDWTKNGGVATSSFGGSAWVTATANDLGVEQIFSAGLELHARSKDLLVAISSSGNSINITRAIEDAREKATKIVTLTGLAPTNPVRVMGDLNLYVPAKTYGMVEVEHQYLLHLWLDCYMGVVEWDRSIPQDMRSDSYIP